MDIAERVKSFIALHQLFFSGDKVLVAVSGGPDSMALLHLLHGLQQELEITLHVAHLNHGLRGAESEADAKFVKAFCAKQKIACTIGEGDVISYQKEHKLSLETAAREVRYCFLQTVAQKVQAQRIALGHHGDDQGETVLMHLLRGCGLSGLAGISPLRDNIYIRPLLILRRREIEEYCQEKDLNYRIDQTNNEADCLRNILRLQLIPHLEKKYNPDLVGGLNRLAEISREENSYLEELATATLEELILPEAKDQIKILRKEFKQRHLALRRRLIQIIWQKITHKKTNLSFEHVERIMHGAETPGNRVLQLPGGYLCVLNFQYLILQKAAQPEARGDYCYLLKVPGDIILEELGLKITADIFPFRELSIEPQNLPKNEAVFDFQKTGGRLFVRRRRAGDVFRPQGMNQLMRLKKFLINQKVPKEKRDVLPLICNEQNILWVSGERTGEECKVTPETVTVLRLKIENYR